MAMNYVQKATQILILSFFVWIMGVFALSVMLMAGWANKDPALYAMLVWSALYAIFIIGLMLTVGNRFWKDYGNMNWEE